jgi:glycerol-3-phosphate acyltransferase PlsY
MSLAGPAIMVLASWRAWGGKGVATALGVVVALSPAIGGLALAIWLTTAVITRYSSLSALIACIFGPIAAYVLAYAPIGGSYLADPQLAEFAVFLAILIVICHRDNIGRLMRGEESRINLKSPQPREGSP